VRVAIPADAVGNYFLELRLSAPETSNGLAARTRFNKSLPVRVESLTAEVRRLRARVGEADNAALDFYERVLTGEVNPHRNEVRPELERAAAMLDRPDAVWRGDLRRVFRSTADKTLQPYRLFVPSAYDPAKPAPLLVALHGMGGDENSMFNTYADGRLQREAERTGMLVACPKGRDSASMYRDAAAQDVLDTVADVRRAWAVDGARIYLMGHSMGGYGTWSLAMAHPGVFAAIGPIAGGGNPAGVAAIARIPMYVVHGDNDKTVPVQQSRVMVQAARAAGARVVYVEVKGGGHGDVVAPQLGPMLDFFLEQHR
jgi:predicted peptidase